MPFYTVLDIDFPPHPNFSQLQTVLDIHFPPHPNVSQFLSVLQYHFIPPPDNPVVDPDPLDKFLVLQSREERNVDVGHNDLDDEKGRTLGNRFIVSSKILEGPPHTFSAPL